MLCSTVRLDDKVQRTLQHFRGINLELNLGRQYNASYNIAAHKIITLCKRGYAAHSLARCPYNTRFILVHRIKRVGATGKYVKLSSDTASSSTTPKTIWLLS